MSFESGSTFEGWGTNRPYDVEYFYIALGKFTMFFSFGRPGRLTVVDDGFCERSTRLLIVSGSGDKAARIWGHTSKVLDSLTYFGR